MSYSLNLYYSRNPQLANKYIFASWCVISMILFIYLQYVTPASTEELA